MKQDYFAAIDIGTNAGRVLIGYVIPQDGHLSVKKVLLTRLPFRLGEEVFDSGNISSEKEEMLIHGMHAFKHLLEAYGVKKYKAIATSAMREAGNARSIVKRIKKECGIKVEIIDGEKEANYIFSTFQTQSIDHSKPYLFIDVGGGSTELSLISKGKRRLSASFKIGTIRVRSKKVSPTIWKEIKHWLKENIDFKETSAAIGTGGNANRIVKILDKKYPGPLTHKEIIETRNYVASFSLKDRIEKLRLKPDRADVLIPAADIYLKIMKLARINKMYVPKMGVADGIIITLHQQGKKKE